MDNPYEAPEADVSPNVAVELNNGGLLPTEPLQRAAGWMKFIGIIGIIFLVLFLSLGLRFGVLGGTLMSDMPNEPWVRSGGGVVLTLFFVVFPSVGIWVSVLLLQADMCYSRSGSQSHYAGSKKLRAVFLIIGVLTALSLVLQVLPFLAGLVA